MIGYCKGEVVDDQVVLTNSGVGIAVTTPNTLKVGSTVELWVTTVVRQDAIVCYGFESRVEQALFLALTRPAGAGPGAALSLIGKLGVAQVVRALRAGDEKALRRAGGVGPTLARRLIAEVQLPDCVTQAIDLSADEEAAGQADRDVTATLAGLGFDERAAAKAVAGARAELGGEVSDDADGEATLLAVALRTLRGAA